MFSDGQRQASSSTSIKVAAIQYGPGNYQYVSGCSSDTCGLTHFIKKAAQNADYIVTPEYVLPGGDLEPAVGDRPGTDSRWSSSSTMKKMARLANEKNVTLIFQLKTRSGSKRYNSQIVIDRNGRVVASHRKYYLFGGEKSSLTAGDSCCDLFDTPVGKAGLLICADINCIVYLDSSKSSCTVGGFKKLKAFVAKRPKLIFFSSYWMAWRNPIWRATNVMAKLARYSGAYVVGANTISGKYHGGGVFAPNGTALHIVDDTRPGIAYGTIPRSGSGGGTYTPPSSPSTGTGSTGSTGSTTSSSRLVITEIMANPSEVYDTKGEWFEIYNAGSSTVDLDGWTVQDNSGSAFTIRAPSSGLKLQRGRYMVLGRNGSSSTNGGVDVDYVYKSFSLTNGGDKISLHSPTGALVDSVTYTSSWDIKAGASISLKSPSLNNATKSNWCLETSAWSGSDGDKGTPGAAAGCN